MTYIIDAVDSALKVLNCVAASAGLGVTEVALKTGINKSRTYRMLCTLELHRYVTLDAKSATYALGPQAFVLGVAAVQQNTLVSTAHSHMLVLNHEINETIVLRVREGSESICVARCETTHEMRTVATVGNRRPLHTGGASSKVLAAFAPVPVRLDCVEKIRELKGEVGATRFATELETIKEKEYAITVGELTPGATAIAVPIRNMSGEVVASVSISAPSARIPEADIPGHLIRLQKYARLISGDLGFKR